jgi:putative FmdB family regulatory protein
MPIYEYRCDNGHFFDVMQRMSEDPLSSCVECGAPVQKVLHPVNIAFKGSGFYSTDYKNGGSKENGSKSGESSKKSESSESKPEKKKESASTAKKQD